MTERLNAALNFICTYEKAITINGVIVDIIEEFSFEDGKVLLYGYNNTYEFVFSSVNFNIEGANVNISFYGDSGGTICF